MFYHDFFWVWPAIVIAWIVTHGIGGIFGLILTIWILSWMFHPWRRWGYYHPYYGRPWRYGPPPQTALDMLEERYAKGEIQREEYLQKRRDLMDRGGGT